MITLTNLDLFFMTFVHGVHSPEDFGRRKPIFITKGPKKCFAEPSIALSHLLCVLLFVDLY